MRFINTPLKDAYIIEIEPSADQRGLFARLFCKKEIKTINHEKEIVQINHSVTRKKGSIRGMHYQIPPSAEIKIVKAIKGSVYDVIIDVRRNSPTFLKYHAENISYDNLKSIYIPEGFAHGFQTLEDECELLYFHTSFYDPQNERAIRYDDPLIGIKWPLSVADISEKDRCYPYINNSFEGVGL
ncbi:MAG: dTDP-4-dehydrorhamnose 3,5-epimerase [Thermodesulfobacteriota bacterium]